MKQDVAIIIKSHLSGVRISGSWDNFLTKPILDKSDNFSVDYTWSISLNLDPGYYDCQIYSNDLFLKRDVFTVYSNTRQIYIILQSSHCDDRFRGIENQSFLSSQTPSSFFTNIGRSGYSLLSPLLGNIIGNGGIDYFSKNENESKIISPSLNDNGLSPNQESNSVTLAVNTYGLSNDNKVLKICGSWDQFSNHSQMNKFLDDPDIFYITLPITLGIYEFLLILNDVVLDHPRMIAKEHSKYQLTVRKSREKFYFGFPSGGSDFPLNEIVNRSISHKIFVPDLEDFPNYNDNRNYKNNTPLGPIINDNAIEKFPKLNSVASDFAGDQMEIERNYVKNDQPLIGI